MIDNIICPSCGTPNDPNANFCEGCGGSLAAAKQAAQAMQEAPAAPEPAPAPAPAPAPLAEPVYSTSQTDYQQPSYTYDDNADSSQSDTGDKQATASVILGIVGLCLCCCTPCGIAGLICAILAKKNGATGGKVTAGLVMAIIILVINAISLVYNIIAAASGASNYYMDMLNNLY